MGVSPKATPLSHICAKGGEDSIRIRAASLFVICVNSSEVFSMMGVAGMGVESLTEDTWTIMVLCIIVSSVVSFPEMTVFPFFVAIIIFFFRFATVESEDVQLIWRSRESEDSSCSMGCFCPIVNL
jgi:hypothetical protein